MEVCLDGYQADSQGREIAVEVVVFGAGSVFAHAGITDPVIFAFAATPVAASQRCELACGVGGRGKAGDVESDRRLFTRVEGGAAGDDDQRACAGEPGLQGLEGIDLYVALIAASMAGVGFFRVGEKGVVWAFFAAAL